MIQFSFVYNRKKKLRKDGTGLVQIKAYMAGKNKYITTNIYLSPEHWSKKQKQCVYHPNALQINAELRRQITAIENYALNQVQKNSSITLEQLGNYLKYEDAESFTHFWEYELTHDNVIKPNTQKAHHQSLNYWKSFRADVQFSELTYSTILEFDRFLKTKNLNPNTIHGHHKRLKRYIYLAIKKDVFSGKNPYLKFPLKKVKTTRVILTNRDLLTLEQLTFEPQEYFYQPILDLFLFSCYTGLRFSDVRNLNSHQIEIENQGYTLKLKAQKTGKHLILPLYKIHNKKPEQIINRYWERAQNFDGFFFPKYTNQYVNRTLKKIAQIAGIHKKLTTHVARHTFATHLASKVPIHILKEILQHSSIETTMVYLHLSNKMIDNALDGVQW
ncbi:site-specific integrase [Aureispira sp. CCB-QB1]|uniref:site-specific integrase n=1 Tax=Aureispira sp. CCB-QB1 TaxID=1313421 RepID=UPI00069862AB|nr:site-specific integrase [Aureispira sp. CCB-QB1]